MSTLNVQEATQFNHTHCNETKSNTAPKPINRQLSEDHNYVEMRCNMLVKDPYNIQQNALTNTIIHYRNIFAGPNNFTKRKIEYSKMKVYDDKFRDESLRYESLKPFFSENFSLKLARAGFYKNPEDTNNDKVKCIYCQGSLEKWDECDNPMKEHMKNFPTCPFLLKLNVENVSKPLEVEKEININMPEKIYECDNVIVEVSIPLNKIHEEVVDLTPVKKMDLFWRESTFKKYQNIIDLSVNGLYVLSENDEDYLQCCSCSKRVPILDGVEKLGENLFHDNNCKLLALSKKSVNENKIHNKRCIIEYAVTNEEVEARMDQKNVLDIIERFKFNKTIVRNTIEKKLKITGMDYPSSYELIKDVKKYNESKSSETHVNLLEFILKDACVVCMDNPVEMAFLPCGHLKTCCRCSDHLVNCPVCRNVIERKVKHIRLNSTK